jgi:hypothetical protein
LTEQQVDDDRDCQGGQGTEHSDLDELHDSSPRFRNDKP